MLTNNKIHQGKKLAKHIKDMDISKGEFGEIVSYSKTTCAEIWRSPEIDAKKIHRILEHSERLKLDRSFFFPPSEEETEDLKLVLKSQQEIKQELNSLSEKMKSLEFKLDELLKKNEK